MRLSKIKLAGFKSFVDPTTVPLPGNRVGVVGPNGCGKSNIIDAVRWVMGESSAKHLRGDSMADVIFNGSTSRKPVGQASVELVFDNSDGSLGGQYAKYNEISIKRVVHRDGQSSYYLNGTRCRRRDITDIFLGTGLGPRSYAIIEQGTISRLIEARPEELRVFLEEAAGISKYKERRRETENRIRHTRDNLDRLDDLREELDKQLAHLQRQARTAERYKEMKQEERILKGQLQALRWRVLNAEAQTLESHVHEQETALEAERSHQRSAEAAIEHKREEHAEATDAFNRIQGEYYGLGADLARLEQSIQHAKERRQQQQQDLGQVERSWNDAQAHMESDRKRIAELRAELEAIEPAYREAEENERRSAAALAECEESMAGWQREWEEFNATAAEPQQTAQVERARLHQLEQQSLQSRQRLERMAEERNALSIDSLEQEARDLEERLAELELTAAGLQEQVDGCVERIGTRREKNNEESAELDRLRTELQHLRGRQSSLEALQQDALGKHDGAVTDWLESQGLHDARRLAQGLEVADGWERAVETVLGFDLEAVCVENLAPAAARLAALEHGSVALFDTAAASEGAPGANGTALLEKVSAPWPLGGLMAGIYAAEDLDGALAMRAALAPHESAITRDGEWIGPGWLRVARDADGKAGVLHREQELRSLAEEITRSQEQVGLIQERLETGRDELKRLEEERESLQRQLNEASRHHAEAKAQLSARQARAEQIRQRGERLKAEAEEVERHLSEVEAEAEAARNRLHEALAQMETLAERREQLVRRRDELQSTLEHSRESARRDRDAAHEVVLKSQTLRTELTSTEQALERMESQLGQLAERREELRLALEGSDVPIKELGGQLEELLNRRSDVEKRLVEARKAVEEIDHALRKNERERTAAEQKAQEVQSRLEQARMAWQELKVRRQTLQEQVTEAGFELKDLLEALGEDADVAVWERDLESVGQRIQRLGPINLAAIEEFEQQSERKQYLDAQHADLIEALETLESAIRKIDRETRTRFKETFDLVNKGLQEKFPRLFGGGHAYLELTGEDLLDTGVTVMARPPGKRNSTIHLLSGGEKALTAVALVFAIFDLNPSPFCMLDEVDAPLDDANVGRFCDMVREMSGQVQFIFITHNKTTMEMAEQLSGVTMHEPGVSRMVMVDVDAAVEMVAV